MFELAGVIIIISGFIAYYWWVVTIKDAPFAPLDPEVVDEIMNIARVGKKDIFYDLGSGDGRVVVAAALRGAKAKGIELDRVRVMYSRLWIRMLRLGKKAKIIHGDFFKANISDATVVCVYLLPRTQEKLQKKLKKDLKKGTKVVGVVLNPNGSLYGPLMLYRV